MQIVDVLGHDRGNLALLVQRRERAMTAAGLGCGKSGLHCKASPPSLVSCLTACDKFVERDWSVASPHPARRAEIRYPTFGGDTGAGERHDACRRSNHITELFDTTTKVGCDHSKDPKVKPQQARLPRAYCRLPGQPPRTCRRRLRNNHSTSDGNNR